MTPPIAMLPNIAASHPTPTTAPIPGSASIVTRLAAVAAVAPIATPTAAPSNLPSRAVSLLLFCFRKGTIFVLSVALYQVSELFEITLVSEDGRPATSSATMTRRASAYES